MKSKLVLGTLFALLLTSVSVFAQVTVSGKVTSTAGDPLIGVNIRQQGTTNGASTDIDGNYKISVPDGSILFFSYTGFASQSHTVNGSGTVNITLEEDALLDEVVVTALGISRDKKSLTYGAQEISGGDLSRVKDANVINGLSGRTAGLQINRSGSGVGGSTRVVMRGQKSTRDNNVLYVIDGVPMFNFSPAQPGDIWGQSSNSGNVGRDGGDAISNINPEDIESVTVLKGASAAALYGSQAANGVINITTKKGKAGQTKIEFNSNTTFEQAVMKPELQFTYGSRASENFSWGPAETNPNHVNDFFQTGATYINSVALSGGTEGMQTYFSYANTTSQGIIPTSSLKRHTLTLRETASFLDNKLTASANFNYTNQRGDNRSVSGMYYNPLTGLYLFPRSRHFETFGKDNYERFNDGTKLYEQNWVGSRDDWQNPYWILNRNPNFDLRNRFYTTGTLEYKFNSWMSLQVRGNLDMSYDDFEQHSYATTEPTLADANGRFVMSNQKSTVKYGDAMLKMKHDFNNFSLYGHIGSSINKVKSNLFYVDSKGADMYYANNFVIQNIKQGSANIAAQVPSQTELQSVFASASLGYKGMVFLDVTGRNDWSSTLAFTNSTSFFYPSVGLSALLSDMFSMKKIDFLKVRASYAQVGNGVNAYDTNIGYSFPSGGATAPKVGVLPGTEVKNELSKSLELGADVRFWHNRVGLDLAWYKTNTTNQRIQVPVPEGSGLSSAIINAGNIQNKGVEISLNIEPVRKSNVSWNTGLYFTKNTNKVISLTPIFSDGIYTISEGGVNNYDMIIREGHPYGEIAGKGFKYLNGGIVFDTLGKPVAGLDTILGNPAPDFTLGWNNTVKFGNFSVGLLIDGRFGGEVMSITQAVLDRFGASAETEAARNAGGVQGIKAVNEDGTPYTGTIDPEKYYTAVGGRDGITEAYIYDGTSVRVRELTIGYAFPKYISNKISKNSSLRVSLVGRNLLYLINKAPFDPEVSMSTGTGLQGVDVFSAPPVRSFGVNVGLTF